MAETQTLEEIARDLGAASTTTNEPFPEVDEREEMPPSVVLRDVTKTFTVAKRWLDRSGGGGKLQALRGVSLRVAHGVTLGVVVEVDVHVAPLREPVPSIGGPFLEQG